MAVLTEVFVALRWKVVADRVLTDTMGVDWRYLAAPSCSRVAPAEAERLQAGEEVEDPNGFAHAIS